MAKRLYQEWEGSNKFFLGGRLIFGPDVRSLGVTFILIAIPVTIFCIFVARHLMQRFHYPSGIAFMVVTVVYTFYVLILLLLTASRDPGIIPRNAHPLEPEEEFDLTMSPSEWSEGQTPQLQLPRTKDVMVNGVVVKVKYCDTCFLYRPPRCSHCSVCNNCVQHFDHHCPWVGQCIGLRNYRFFFFFIASTTLLCIFVFAMSAIYIKFLIDGEARTLWRAIRRSPASVFLMIYTFVAIWFVGGLTFFHLYLIGSNQTTYENFRYRYEKKKNPNNLGILKNFCEVFCTSIPPSKNNFRAKVQQESFTSGNENCEIMGHIDRVSKPVADIQKGVKFMWSPPDGHALAIDIGGLHRQWSHGMKPVTENKGEFDDASLETLDTLVKGGDVRGANSRSSSWHQKNGSWGISPDILALAIGAGEGGRIERDGTRPGNR